MIGWLVDWLIDCCVAFAPLVTRASPLFYDKAKVWGFPSRNRDFSYHNHSDEESLISNFSPTIPLTHGTQNRLRDWMVNLQLRNVRRITGTSSTVYETVLNQPQLLPPIEGPWPVRWTGRRLGRQTRHILRHHSPTITNGRVQCPLRVVPRGLRLLPLREVLVVLRLSRRSVQCEKRFALLQFVFDSGLVAIEVGVLLLRLSAKHEVMRCAGEAVSLAQRL